MWFIQSIKLLEQAIEGLGKIDRREVREKDCEN